MVKLYHYTTKQNLDKIQRERCIYASGGRGAQHTDMFFGPGVYLTTLDPSNHSKDEIGENNWGRGGATRVHDGFLDHYIEVDIPDDDVNLAKCDDREGKDKWIYRKAYLPLDKYEWKSGKNSDWNGLGIGLGVLGGIALLGAGIAAWNSWGDDGKGNNGKDSMKQRRN